MTIDGKTDAAIWSKQKAARRVKAGPIHNSAQVLTKRAGGSAMHLAISHGHICEETNRTTVVKGRIRKTGVERENEEKMMV